jgi:hypothetical protein
VPITGSGGGTIDTGSFATTGSNTFNGNQIINGVGYNKALTIVSENSDQSFLIYRSGSATQNWEFGITNPGNSFLKTRNRTWVQNDGVDGELMIHYLPTKFENGIYTQGSQLSITGSVVITGDQIITGSITLAGSQFVSVGGVNGNQVSFNSSSLSLQNPALTNITYASPTAYLQSKGNFYLENQVGNVGSGSINISALGGGNLNLTGSQLRLSGVDFIPFSASLNTRILAITGSGGTINTGSFITTGSINSQQNISGSIGINRIYAPTSASIAATLNTYGSNTTTILFNYNDINSSLFPSIYDITNNSALWSKWKVNGTGVTNATISDMQYGNDGVEVTINQTATNNQSYSLSGEWNKQLTIDPGYAKYSIISGGLQVNTNGNELQFFGGAANSVVFTSQQAPDGGGLNQFIWNVTMLTASYASFNMQNEEGVQNGFALNPNTSQYNGQDVWQMYGGGESNFGGGDNSIFIAPINSSKLYGYKNIELTGSLNVSSSFTASLANGYTWVGDGNNKTKLVATSSFGSGATINTGSFLTTGSRSDAKQTVLGDFTFDTIYTASGSYQTQNGGGLTVYVSYGDIFNGTPAGNKFIYWLDTNFAGVTVSGTGVVNGAITGYSYGSEVEVYLNSATITNGAFYTFTGPYFQNVDVTGSFSVV